MHIRLFVKRRALGRLAIVVAVGGAVTVACSSTLYLDDYDRTCATDEDCVVVFVGDVCDCNCNGVGAISKKGEESYRRDRSGIECGNACEPCAPRHVAVCRAGRCEAERCAGNVKFCTSSCGESPTLEACECPPGMIETSSCVAGGRG